ncbi:MAG: hypothetical protein M4579_004656 [Chaenotheca gracillima]|nr:MAG: hypothetical protein M4579_004656 [Chaenotheca gracillima]
MNESQFLCQKLEQLMLITHRTVHPVGQASGLTNQPAVQEKMGDEHQLLEREIVLKHFGGPGNITPKTPGDPKENAFSAPTVYPHSSSISLLSNHAVPTV